VVKPEHPMYSKVQDFLLKDSSTITDIKHAAKLQALRLVGGERVWSAESELNMDLSSVLCAQ